MGYILKYYINYLWLQRVNGTQQPELYERLKAAGFLELIRLSSSSATLDSADAPLL
jgi:hypothetical protein